MTTPSSPPRAARFLERALLLTILAHALAMLSMALLLLPGMPGGGHSLSERSAYIASNPLLWHLGWFPWHLTALSDVLLAIALLRTRWISRLPALLILLLTLIAFAIEQPNEFLWETQGIVLAQAGNLAAYQAFETPTYTQIAGWAALGYTLTAILWSWCFFRAGTWRRWLTWLSVITWGLLLVVSIAPLLPDTARPSDALVATGNALGFILMLIWFASVTELVLRRARPDEAHGRMAVWRHPRRDLVGRLLNVLANSRLARAYGEWLPPVEFISDITDVIYVNYLVEAERLTPLVPWGLELQRLGTDGKYALFTHLTYRHGHFGPMLLGRLRHWLSSPIQSNWRIYVRDPQTDLAGIYFVTTAIDQTLQSTFARLLSEGIPMHLLSDASLTLHPAGIFDVRLDPGLGSAPDLAASLRPASLAEVSPAWQTCFPTFPDFLAYCVPQDRGYLLSALVQPRHPPRN